MSHVLPPPRLRPVPLLVWAAPDQQMDPPYAGTRRRPPLQERWEYSGSVGGERERNINKGGSPNVPVYP